MEIIAKCEHCGRGFFTMPATGFDRYRPDRWSSKEPLAADGACGGKVVRVPPPASDKE